MTIELVFRDTDESFWIDVFVDGQPYGEIGTFDTEGERQCCYDDLVKMLLQRTSAVLIPDGPRQ